jgi:hypothetical protein
MGMCQQPWLAEAESIVRCSIEQAETVVDLSPSTA